MVNQKLSILAENFPKLEHLQISCMSESKVGPSAVKHPNLKTFSTRSSRPNSNANAFHFPNLEFLSCMSVPNTADLWSPVLFNPPVCGFENLRHLVVDSLQIDSVNGLVNLFRFWSLSVSITALHFKRPLSAFKRSSDFPN